MYYIGLALVLTWVGLIGFLDGELLVYIVYLIWLGLVCCFTC